MPTKIKRIQVSNLKAIAEANLTLNGATAIITAGNNKGKTSLLRSLIDRVRSIKTNDILKQGEKEGFYEMEFTNGEKMRWDFRDGKKEKLTFITERDIPTSLTREIGQVYFPKGFDIDSFLEDEPAKQRKQLEKICGLDFTQIDKDIEAARESRKYLKKKAEDDYARTCEFDPAMTDMINMNELNQPETFLREAGLTNEKLKNFKFKVDSKKESLSAKKKEIEELKAKIAVLQDECMQLETDIDKGDNYLKEHPEINKEQIIAMVDKVAAIKKRHKEIEENNKARANYQLWEKTCKQRDEADAEVKKLEDVKADWIKNSDGFPDGFGFSENGITYEGFEFNKQSLSLSKIYIAAIKLAARGLGEVKTLYFDASALDRNSLMQIQDWAITQGLQLLIERPAFEGGDIEYELIQEHGS